MDFLLDNPLVMMDGPAFLVLFGLLITTSTVVIAAMRAAGDKSDKLNIPSIPPDPDPVEIAYLRGGPNEAARSVVFSLLQKKLVQIETVGKQHVLTPVLPAGSVRGLSGIEQTAMDWIGAVREAGEVFQRKDGLLTRFEPYFSVYQDRLEGRQLLTSGESSARIKRYARIAAIIISLTGSYKIFASMIYGNFNVVFTLILIVIGVGVVLTVGRLPRMTKLGKLYLDRLYLAFEDLKYRSQAPYLIRNSEMPPVQSASFAGVDPLLLSVGLFGPSILAGTIYSNYNVAFQRSQHPAGTGGGCGSGSACGSCSSSSGSDGGGSSCSSGCGGGGCGGGGCGG